MAPPAKVSANMTKNIQPLEVRHRTLTLIMTAAMMMTKPTAMNSQPQSFLSHRKSRAMPISSGIMIVPFGMP